MEKRRIKKKKEKKKVESNRQKKSSKKHKEQGTQTASAEHTNKLEASWKLSQESSRQMERIKNASLDAWILIS